MGDIKLLYDKVEELINHIEKQADLGLKFNFGSEPNHDAAEYRMFVNELVLGDNTILAELDNTRITFLNHTCFILLVPGMNGLTTLCLPTLLT